MHDDHRHSLAIESTPPALPLLRLPPPPWVSLAYEAEIGVEDTEHRPARPGHRAGGDAA